VKRTSVRPRSRAVARREKNDESPWKWMSPGKPIRPRAARGTAVVGATPLINEAAVDQRWRYSWERRLVLGTDVHGERLLNEFVFFRFMAAESVDPLLDLAPKCVVQGLPDLRFRDQSVQRQRQLTVFIV